MDDIPLPTSINERIFYESLINLVETNEAFYFIDQGDYRVFNYRLASYTDFCQPFALEARGVMFYIKDKSNPKLVCRPFKKFFNLYENPFTTDLDLSKIQKAAVKEDGSLITSYLNLEDLDDRVKVKSKQSLVSSQAIMAMEYLKQKPYLSKEIHKLTDSGLTVLMELVSPANRIVLEYPKTELRVVGVRINDTGVMVDKSYFENLCPNIFENWVKELTDIGQSFVDDIPNQEGIEGYVFTLEDGTMFKHKTDWYKNLHHLKDSVDCTSRLFEAIITERIDDVKAMFHTDDFTMNRISEMESKVIPIHNSIISEVESFYDKNRELSRKDYAILGQKELGVSFHLAMNKFLGKEVNYQEFAIKNRKTLYGITDTETLSLDF